MFRSQTAVILSTLFIFSALVTSATGQTATYHLHKEASATAGLFQLKTTAPDSSAATASSVDLKNRPLGEYLIKAFDTRAGVPNAAGVVPAGSAITFTLWMSKTSNAGTLYPRAKLNLNSSTGTSMCVATGTAPLTTTTTAYTLTCRLNANVAQSASDRLYLWAGVDVASAPGNTGVKAQLRIEGSLNGNYDSRVVVPVPTAPPIITNILPASGPAGTVVNVTGINFGATQGTSSVNFNGVPSSPTTWSTGAISTIVPAAATSGNVVVSVGGVQSNGLPFTVVATGSIIGTVTRFSGGEPVGGATVDAMLSGTVRKSTTTTSNGTYTLDVLDPGTYDIRVSAPGFSTELQQGIHVTASATATANVALLVPGLVSGKVIEADGATPIQGATVSLYDDPVAIASVITDAAGDYVLQGVHPGIRTLRAVMPGYVPAQRNVTIFENHTTVSNFSLTTTVVRYAYDAVGRLSQVTDPNGESAIYRYDAVGNIVSIERVSASGIGISTFDPVTGPVGTAVRISGTSLLSPSGPLTVTFNGTPATVTDSTPTQLTAIVPMGATTGPIEIASAVSSATSRMPFTIALNDGSPVINDFTPTIGDSNTTVVINGTNFDSRAANNLLALNTFPKTDVLSSTGTTLTARARTGATSGRFTLRTPRGVAESTADFFVPPPPYSAVDVLVTGRTSIGASTVVAIGTSSKIGLLVFHGTAGQLLTVRATDVTYAGCGLDFSILRPDGTTLASGSNCFTDPFIDVTALPVTGTYTLLIDPRGTSTGMATWSIYDAAAFTGALAIGSPGTSVSLPTPGENARLTFAGAAGQLVSVYPTSVTYGNCALNFHILGPDGTTLASGANCFATPFIDATALPVTGTYTLLVDPSGPSTGSATWTVYDAGVFTGSIEFGSGFPLVVSVYPANVTLANCGFDVSILRPDGTALASSHNCFATAFIDATTLPATGTYTVLIDPRGPATGSATWTVYDAAVVNGSIEFSTPLPLSMATPGQIARLTFGATAGQVVSVHPTNVTYTNCALSFSILQPDGTPLATGANCFATPFIDATALPITGTYTLVIDPSGPSTGSATWTIYRVVDILGAMNIGDGGLDVPMPTPGQSARLTFEGGAGQQISVTATNVTFGNCGFNFSILRPDGATLASGSNCFATPSINAATLPATGTYTLLIDTNGPSTGSAAWRIY